jgi:hypothetical protein
MTEHEYPSAYRPGAHWATDEAWQILDKVKPGLIPGDVRAFLAGLIAGTLMRYDQLRGGDNEHHERDPGVLGDRGGDQAEG